ncbi:AAA family ATPase [Streptomyces boninensis]|uniref:AAA family ATPase n=1 Tax=Streptomyces boninensis TaxID=2039455 RepID=UPI003B222E14
MTDWLIFKGAGAPHDRVAGLPLPPPWRTFDGEPLCGPPPDVEPSSRRRLGDYEHAEPSLDSTVLERVNAALYLRRPLLVTGPAGAGKSTLAHAVAYELGLGRVLQWPIVSRTALRDGLYQYDAIGRLHDAQLDRADARPGIHGDIGRYLRLGPLGTALLPAELPRVLLVDELDKSDVDLPNDLLNVLEEGEFRIPELQRTAEPGTPVPVQDDDGRQVDVLDGKVRCRAFPFVVITSNGERDFPEPLLRRCIQVHLDRPGEARLAAMVRAHFGDAASSEYGDVIRQFAEAADGAPAPAAQRAADRLLNAIYLMRSATPGGAPGDRRHLATLLLSGPDGSQG